MPTDPLDRLKSALCCYRIDRELGRGGMATVYLAHDLKHDRAVALKAILPDVSSTLGPERFLREIRTAARLSHPHIVGLFDSGEVDGLFYYVMPYIRGESLRQRLQRTGRLGFDEAAAIARDVAAALDYAHATGLLHRDIKPENILLHEGEAMVTDFGIALALNPAGTVRMTEAGRSLGTPEYMSPEQIAGDRDMDGRSDQYAVACVVYEMLAGEPPYQAPSPAGIILKQATAPVPSLRRLRPDTPLHIEQAVTRALAKAPEERFPFVNAFAEGIQPQDCSIVTPLRIHQPVNGDPESRSIVVLPFANLSPDTENEYFADGMTEEIINALANVPGLRVIARTSAFAFKGKNQDVRSIGRELHVTNVVEGSVRRAGSRLRITVQLVEVANGHHLWSERFDRDLADVFAIQDEIARTIAARLRPAAATTDVPRVGPPTRSLEAYEAYLRGRFYWDKGTRNDYGRAVQQLERAIVLDPEYARAYACLAEILCESTIYFGGPEEQPGRAKAHALRAIELDPGHGDAHAILGYVRFWFDWEWSEALEALERAVRLNPGSATAHNYYSVVLATLWGAERAIELCRRAIQLDPLWVNARQSLQWAFYQAGRYDEAITAGTKALELEPGYLMAHRAMGFSLVETGALADAEAAFQRALEIAPDDGMAQAGLIQVFVRTGRMEAAKRGAAELSRRARAERGFASFASWAHAACGEQDLAFAWIDRAIAERSVFLASLRSFRWWYPLRSDPRFTQVVEQLRIPAKPAASVS